MSEIEIRAVSATPKMRETLSEILMEVVAAGGSVSFMHPLEPERANAFWDVALAAAARDERIVLGAWDGEVLAGTVTLLLNCPPNQPHRAEIAKLMTRPSHRRRGVAAALMRAAEALAVERARTLLVLDTATEGGASRLYEGLGFILAGEIPDYALKPYGGLTGTLIYWKRIGGKPQMVESSTREIRFLAESSAEGGDGGGDPAGGGTQHGHAVRTESVEQVEVGGGEVADAVQGTRARWCRPSPGAGDHAARHNPAHPLVPGDGWP